MDLLFPVIHILGIICGAILILIAYRHRTPAYTSFSALRPWSRQGINPLYPLTLHRIRYLWTPAGYRIHVLGVILCAAGILSGVVATLIRWLA